MLRAVNLYEQVYKHLKEQIWKGALAGETLFETQIAEQLGISRTPVREGLRMLESEGLVEQVSSGGFHVLKITVQDLDDAVDARIAVEVLTVRLAAQRMTESQFQDLNAIVERTREALDLGLLGDVMLENESFHRFIAQATGSRLLSQLLDRIYDYVKANNILTEVARRGDVASLMRTFYVEHQAIALAMQDRDVERAADLVRRHLEEVKKHYQAASQQREVGLKQDQNF